MTPVYSQYILLLIIRNVFFSKIIIIFSRRFCVKINVNHKARYYRAATQTGNFTPPPFPLMAVGNDSVLFYKKKIDLSQRHTTTRNVQIILITEFCCGSVVGDGSSLLLTCVSHPTITLLQNTVMVMLQLQLLKIDKKKLIISNSSGCKCEYFVRWTVAQITRLL